jgi:hypothetical protein
MLKLVLLFKVAKPCLPAKAPVPAVVEFTMVSNK